MKTRITIEVDTTRDNRELLRTVTQVGAIIEAQEKLLPRYDIKWYGEVIGTVRVERVDSDAEFLLGCGILPDPGAL